MTAPTTVRSTAGFRSVVLFELNAAGYPIGTNTLHAMTPYTVSGSAISGSAGATVAAGTAVGGSVGYYGIPHSGGKVLTINDPAPRVIPHIGDDAIINLQILPATEPASGELRVDKTNDIVDAIVGNVKKFTIGEANMLGGITSQRGYENQVGALAYSAGQDADPDSSNFGANLWDFRVFPKVTLFQRDTGYGQEANERLYSFTPNFVTAHLWGVAFSMAVEGFKRGQILRGVSQYKPFIVSYLGDGSTTGFPFDSAMPAASASKVAVWKNGVLQSSGMSVSVRGISFAVAPASNDVIVVFGESA